MCIPGTLGQCFHYWCAVYAMCKRLGTLWLVGRAHLFALYIISLSSFCRLSLRNWTFKMLVRYMLSSVCLRLSQFSQLSFAKTTEFCDLRSPYSLVIIVKICTLSYHHKKIGNMNHKLLFQARPWNNGTCCIYLTIFLSQPKLAKKNCIHMYQLISCR